MVSFETLIADIRESIEVAELSLINIDKEAALRELNKISTDIDGIESLLKDKGLISQGESH